MYLHLLAMMTLATVAHAADFNSTLLPWEGYSTRALLVAEVIKNIVHDPGLRPVDYRKDILSVQLKVTLKRVLALDAAKQMMTIYVTKSLNWYTHQLSWNMSQYKWDNILLPKKLLWNPDVILLNAVEAEKTDATHIDFMKVHNTGKNTYEASILYKFPCLVDMYNFPFDIQLCHMDFGSWQYGYEQIQLVPLPSAAYLDLSHNTPNNEWLIVGTKEESRKITRIDQIFNEVRLTVALKRFSGFYIEFVFVPTFLLAPLLLMIFWIPPNRPDRTGLGMHIFGGLMLLLLLVVRISPGSSNVKIATYYSVNIVLVACSTVSSALVVSISQKNHILPRIIRNIFVVKIGAFLGITQQYSKLYPCEDDDDSKFTLIRDWQILSVVLDRIFFVLYLFILILCMFLFFPFPREVETEMVSWTKV